MKKTTPTKKSAPAESKSLNTPKAVEAAAKKLKAAKAAAEKPVVAAPAPVKAVRTAKPAAKKAPLAKAAAPAASKPAKAPAVTKVVAVIDVGFGNQLTIRGEGPGLSWDSGVVMACSEDGQAWVWSSSEVTAPVTFKVLANDIAWSAGEDFVVAPGQTVSVSPVF